MKQLECLFTQSDCYRTGQTIVPKGVMIHSTGANNPTLRRYVQPTAETSDREALLTQLGDNLNGNHWNRPGINACVHGFIGKLADGTVAAVQTLPWDHRGWHAGTGTSGASANNNHISFEICEDGLEDKTYFETVYQAAAELTAMLCKAYVLDPLEEGVVISHSEGYRRGVASAHADVEHWFSRFGRSMDVFRRHVAEEMEDDMTQERFTEMMENYLAQLAAQQPSDWSAEERGWAENAGLIRGDENGDKKYKSFCTREQLMTFLYRFSQLLNN